MGKWDMVRLEDVLNDTITGEWGTECLQGETGVKVLRTTNFTNKGVIDFTDVVTRNIAQNKISAKKLKSDDIILEKSGGSDNQPVGRVVFFENSEDVYLCNNFTQILRVNQNKAVPKYVFFRLFYLHKNGTTELLQNKTTGIRNLQVKNYLSIQIPLPPLDVQQKIADVLDKASVLIELRKAQLDKLDLLVKSQFIEMFGDPETNPKGWDKSPIKNHCDYMVPGRDKPRSFSGEIPWITIDDLCILGVTYKSKQNFGLTHKEIHDVGRRAIPVGSVILSCVGNLGITSIAGVDMVINQQLHSFQCRSNTLNCYVMYELMHQKPYMMKMATSTTVAYMNKTVCNSIPIRIPPLYLQNEFCNFVSQADKQKKLLQQSLFQLERNYNSLMQKCFRGELF